MEVYSNQPGVQFYTSNNFPSKSLVTGLPDDKSKDIKGKQGVHYSKHQAFCLETQNYPDAVNHKNFPNSIIKPGECYYHIVKYIFDLYNEEESQSEEEGVVMEFEGEQGEAQEVEEKKDDDDLLGTKLEENGR